MSHLSQSVLSGTETDFQIQVRDPACHVLQEQEFKVIGNFGDLIEHRGEVENISPKDFDPHGQYDKVEQAVKQASDGNVSIFRVQHQGTRAEYYVVGLSKGKIVGLKALAAESLKNRLSHDKGIGVITQATLLKQRHPSNIIRSRSARRTGLHRSLILLLVGRHYTASTTKV